MIQPLVNAFNFFLGILNAMPYAIQTFIMFNITIFALSSFILILLKLRS